MTTEADEARKRLRVRLEADLARSGNSGLVVVEARDLRLLLAPAQYDAGLVELLADARRIAKPPYVERSLGKLIADLADAVEALRSPQVEEMVRLREEVRALRASMGEINGAEPIGCPTPGACSCPTAQPPAVGQPVGVTEYTAEQIAKGHTEFLDAKAEAWMDETDVRAMFVAIGSVFEKWAPPDTMRRFNDQLTALGHQCFVEGAMRAWFDISDQGGLRPRLQSTAPSAGDVGEALTVHTAAMRFENGLIVTMPRPHRHGSLINRTYRELGETRDHGFILSDGSYADRKRAYEIADAAGQIKFPHSVGSLSKPYSLFTEHLWDEEAALSAAKGSEPSAEGVG